VAVTSVMSNLLLPTRLQSITTHSPNYTAWWLEK